MCLLDTTNASVQGQKTIEAEGLPGTWEEIILYSKVQF